jgi:hypothetical protein
MESSPREVRAEDVSASNCVTVEPRRSGRTTLLSVFACLWRDELSLYRKEMRPSKQESSSSSARSSAQQPSFLAHHSKEY